MKASGLKAVIFGSTGAVGQTLVKGLLESSKWERIHCVVRKQPEQWKKFHNKQKLSIQVEADMDKLFKTEEWDMKGYDSMFVCFGCQVKHGEQMFRKIDKTYPLLCADIAVRNKIPHYLLVSSNGSDSKSMMMYLKVKGEVQEELKLKDLNLLTILKPGLIKNRPDQRTVQKIGQFFSFLVPNIQCLDLTIAMRGIAQTKHEQSLKAEKKCDIYENKDLQKFLDSYKEKPNKKC